MDAFGAVKFILTRVNALSSIAIMFTPLVVACLTASTLSIIACLTSKFRLLEAYYHQITIFSVANLDTFARVTFHVTKFYICVASLIARCPLAIQMTCIRVAYLCAIISVAYQITFVVTIVTNLCTLRFQCCLSIEVPIKKQNKRKRCLSSRLPDRCNPFAREFSRNVKCMP